MELHNPPRPQKKPAADDAKGVEIWKEKVRYTIEFDLFNFHTASDIISPASFHPDKGNVVGSKGIL